MTATLTQAQYGTLWRDGMAGPTAALLPKTLARFEAEYGDWDGAFWAMLPTNDGTLLQPINIRD